MSCQINATQSAPDSRGMNYCPVATVTSHMQKTHCRGLKNGDLWDFVSETIPMTREKQGGINGEKKDWQRRREGKKETLKYSEEKEEEQDWDETRQGFTRSNLKQSFRQFGSLLSLYFYKASRNTSSAIHFISIPTPASHLHSVSFTSPFHFSTCHYISWMITYWQFLHWHSLGQDHNTTCIQSRGRFPISSFFLFLRPLRPKSQSDSHVSSNNTPPSPLHLPFPFIQSTSLPSDPHEPLQDIATPRGPEVGSYVPLLHSNKWTTHAEEVTWQTVIRSMPSFLTTGIAGSLNRVQVRSCADHIKAGFIKLNATFLQIQ